MKSIVERAFDWSNGKPQSHGRLQGYVQGANDQRQIDINKACEWLNKNGFFNCSGSIQEKEFRKAMEE